ncbi:unnamed protein product, partial [Rotaria sp. Silwood2]
SLIPYRRAINDRKYVELLGKTWPLNYILLDDAMYTCNPQYAQEDISYIFNRRAATITEEYWLASTTNDWKTATLKLIKTDQNGEIRTYQRGSDYDTAKYPDLQMPLAIKFLQRYNH